MSILFTYDLAAGGTVAQPIVGSHGTVLASSPELQAKRTYHWGTIGETEIVGGYSGRMVSFWIALHDNYQSPEALQQMLELYDALVGKHGKLEETSGARGTYPNCTLERFEVVPFGDENPGPLYDFAGTLSGGWFCRAEFGFRQLLTYPGGRVGT